MPASNGPHLVSVDLAGREIFSRPLQDHIQVVQPPVVFLFSEGLPELVGCSEVWDEAWPSEVQGGPRRQQPFLEGIAEHLSDSIQGACFAKVPRPFPTLRVCPGIGGAAAASSSHEE